MVTWSDFAARSPSMAARGEALLARHQLAYLATVRADGSPRLHPVSPQLIEGRLWVCTPRGSLKARDQLHDPRCVLHWLPGEDDFEFRVRARARPCTDPAEAARIAAAGPHYFRPDQHLFEYDIEEVATARWVNVGQAGTYAVRERWVAGEYRAPNRHQP